MRGHSSSRRYSCTLLCIACSLLLFASSSHAANQFLLPSKTSAAAATAAAHSATEEGFTLDGTKSLTLVFRIKQLPQQPTPPPAYRNFPMWRWNWLGGEGYLLVTRNDLGPLGVLSEMMYFPGRFTPKCSDDKFFSAQRFWVDMRISQQIGRTYWGFPKEMASFEWTSNSVTVKDLKGNVFFNASLEAAAADAQLPAWVNTRIKNGFNTLQWPIKDARINIGNLLKVDMNVVTTAEEKAQAAAEAAVAASLLHGTSASQLGASISTASTLSNQATLVPNRQVLAFPKYEALVLTKPANVWFDRLVFTGRNNTPVALAGSGEVVFVKGSPGELDDPQMYTCTQSANSDVVEESAVRE